MDNQGEWLSKRKKESNGGYLRSSMNRSYADRYNGFINKPVDKNHYQNEEVYKNIQRTIVDENYHKKDNYQNNLNY